MAIDQEMEQLIDQHVTKQGVIPYSLCMDDTLDKVPVRCQQCRRHVDTGCKCWWCGTEN